MKDFAVIETRQMFKQHFIIRLAEPEEVFIFVNPFVTDTHEMKYLNSSEK